MCYLRTMKLYSGAMRPEQPAGRLSGLYGNCLERSGIWLQDFYTCIPAVLSKTSHVKFKWSFNPKTNKIKKNATNQVVIYK
jgi:hypothetical protein